MTRENLIRLFVTSSIGFEKVLLDELLASQRVLSAEMGKGGVWAEVSTFQDVIYLNYALHTANRVLVELVSLQAPRQRNMYHSLYDIDWKLFFRGNETFSIEVPFSTHPDFTNTLFAAQFMKDPICDRLRKETGKRPNVDTKDPDIRFQAFLTEDEFCFYFDSSNIPLFKRGYRTEAKQHVAPLKETLAAGLLLRAGFNPEKDILFDPCAGSGTFLIESILLRYKIAPGLLRKQFGFISHPLYDLDQDRAVKNELDQRSVKAIEEEPEFKPIAVEKDHAMYRAILQSLTRTGVLDKAHVINSVFQGLDSKTVSAMNKGIAPTFLIANPPYGVRMSSSQTLLEKLYRDLGVCMKEILSGGGRASVLIPKDGILQRSIGLRPSRSFPVLQGGLDCSFVIYDIFPKREIKEEIVDSEIK